MSWVLRWTHASFMRPDVYRYRVYKDPFPHPALRGGVVPRLLSCVSRAMAIAQLTHLRISVPASGAPPGQVPADPGGAPQKKRPSPPHVSFAEDITMLGDVSPPVCSPEQGTPTQFVSAVAEDDIITHHGGADRLFVDRPCHSPTRAGILSVLLAGRRCEYGQ